MILSVHTLRIYLGTNFFLNNIRNSYIEVKFKKFEQGNYSTQIKSNLY